MDVKTEKGFDMVQIRLAKAKPYCLCIGLSLFCLSILFGLLIANAVLVDPWNDGITSFGRCEKVRPDKLLREPANAISNLGFVFVGIYLCGCAFWDWRYGKYVSSDSFEHLGFYPLNTLVYGLALIFEGYGSFHHHASGSTSATGGFMDIFGIFILIWAICLVQLIMLLSMGKVLWQKLRVVKSFYVQVSLAIVFFSLIPVWAQWEDWKERIGFDVLKLYMLGLFGFIGVSTAIISLVTQCKKRQQWWCVFITFSLASIVAGVLCWIPEEIKGVCPQGAARQERDSIFQAHAFWHVGIALALLGKFLYFRTLENEHAINKGMKGLIDFCLLISPSKEEENEVNHFDV
mmetsp:Transcript_8383/g.10060  ORF Transcript_8383/g.10060 Transcript_8383/m.10060 type:complete len:347 (+) Transcript_8383:157-1197(+)